MSERAGLVGPQGTGGQEPKTIQAYSCLAQGRPNVARSGISQDV